MAKNAYILIAIPYNNVPSSETNSAMMKRTQSLKMYVLTTCEFFQNSRKQIISAKTSYSNNNRSVFKLNPSITSLVLSLGTRFSVFFLSIIEYRKDFSFVQMKTGFLIGFQ